MKAISIGDTRQQGWLALLGAFDDFATNDLEV